MCWECAGELIANLGDRYKSSYLPKIQSSFSNSEGSCFWVEIRIWQQMRRNKFLSFEPHTDRMQAVPGNIESALLEAGKGRLSHAHFGQLYTSTILKQLA